MERRRRIVTKIGDVFCAPISVDKKRYFQYIAIDSTHLGGSTIRAFSREYSLDDKPRLMDIIIDEVAFYSHTVLRWGVELGVWEKVGNVPFEQKEIDVLFMMWCDDDIVRYNRTISPLKRWRVWRVNDPDFTYMDNDAFTLENGELTVNDPRFKNERHICEGSIIPAIEIQHRMATRKFTYHGSCPAN